MPLRAFFDKRALADLFYPGHAKEVTAMWYRIFVLSMIVFFIGMLPVLAGEFVIPSWSPITSVVGGSIAALGGIAGAVSGIAVVLTTDFNA